MKRVFLVRQPRCLAQRPRQRRALAQPAPFLVRRAGRRFRILAVVRAEAKSSTPFCRGLEGPSSAPGLSFASLAPTQRPTAACKIRIPSNHIPRQGDRHETHISNFGRSGVCSSEQARLRRQDRWAGIATSSLRQPLRFRIRYRRKPIPGPQPLGRAPVNTGAIDITSPSALGFPGQQTFGAAGQSGICHLRSERSPAQFGQLWVQQLPRTRGRRRRASIPRAPT